MWFDFLETGKVTGEKEKAPTALIIGLVLFAAVLAAVAFILGVLFGKKRYSSNTQYLDQQLNKHKDTDTLKSQNCSDYQLPPTTKPSNLQQVHYTNNLHANHNIVGEGMGEATLQRQKKVYVWDFYGYNTPPLWRREVHIIPIVVCWETMDQEKNELSKRMRHTSFNRVTDNYDLWAELLLLLF